MWTFSGFLIIQLFVQGYTGLARALRLQQLWTVCADLLISSCCFTKEIKREERNNRAYKYNLVSRQSVHSYVNYKPIDTTWQDCNVITFPATAHHCPLYCSVTETDTCEKLVQVIIIITKEILKHAVCQPIGESQAQLGSQNG